MSEPETAAVHADIAAWRPDVLVVLHSIASGPFVNFDGAGAGLAEVFADAAREVDGRWRVRAAMGYPTPGSLGSYYGVDGGMAVLTVELARGQDAASAAAGLARGLSAVVEVAAVAGGGGGAEGSGALPGTAGTSATGGVEAGK